MEFKPLPDIASQVSGQVTNQITGRIEKTNLSGLVWVGMEKIQMPILWQGQILSAEIKAQVNLIAGTSRGIHMSRLYSLLSESLATEPLTWSLLENLAEKFILSQAGLSETSRLSVEFQLPLKRKALKSDLQGWRLYPVKMEVIKALELKKKMTVEILYSSTCPASTALSKELWKQDLKAQFAEDETWSLQKIDQWVESHQGMPGAPHAQRSRALVEVQMTELTLSPQDFIEGLEAALKTPVQTAVKRVDEQEFARLNGKNTMFCEDAARKVQNWLDTLKFVTSYHGLFEHQESLHPHNAVAVIEKV